MTKKIIAGTAKEVELINSGFGDENQIYDDPVSFQGIAAGFELTQLLPSEIVVKAVFYYHEKEYPAAGIYINEDDYINTTRRYDIQRTGFINITKSIYSIFSENDFIDLSINFNIIANNSNSFWYNYNNRIISLNFDYQF